MKSLILILAIISTARAVTFNCTFAFWSSSNLPTVYTCYFPEVSNFDEGEIVTAVDGWHRTGKSNVDVKALLIQDVPHLSFFPRGLEKFFPNLEAFYIRNSSISALTGDELEPFKNLYWFQLAFSRNFERVPENLFDSKPLMRHISFYANNIKYVGENLFRNLPDLNYLNFQDNNCINKYAENNNEEIQALIEHLQSDCMDVTFLTAPSTECGELNEVICKLQEQNQALIALIAEMKEDVKGIKAEVTQVKNSLAGNRT